MLSLPRFIGRALAQYLSTPRPHAQGGTPSDPRKLLQCLQPCDVLLVEGSTRISGAIKYLTQSTWSHAALYVGAQLGGHDDDGRPFLFVEADIVKGVCKRPLAQYDRYHTRICRARNLTQAHKAQIIAELTRQIGNQYDMKNVFDLARYLLPAPPVPQRFRRRLIALGSGDPTKAICSSLIADAFQNVGYPVLPVVSQSSAEAKEIWRIRDKSLYAPRDFDVSPYFEIVKPTLSRGFDYRDIEWSPSSFQHVEALGLDGQEGAREIGQ
ncbi:MAG TPA: YiiX/YebB-like N1pC/P60 family cysteine hydrolase [Ramlibacter sp.]|nr:YiiX/YebB-like N1pC/P60 family cysteine hydrolase [Ramlibacter sp.]